jgi:hypothetical protein
MCKQQNTYIFHCFAGDDPKLLGLGGMPITVMPGQALHGTEITLTTDNDTPLPPPGVLDWHYLQCVMNKFGSRSYKQVDNITYTTVPFRTVDDEADEIWEDDDHDSDDALYPTYWLDKLFSREYKKVKRAESHRTIVHWRSNITTDKDSQ